MVYLPTSGVVYGVHSLKLTVRTSKLMVGRQAFPIGFRPIFRGELLVSRRVNVGKYASPIEWTGRKHPSDSNHACTSSSCTSVSFSLAVVLPASCNDSKRLKKTCGLLPRWVPKPVANSENGEITTINGRK